MEQELKTKNEEYLESVQQLRTLAEKSSKNEMLMSKKLDNSNTRFKESQQNYEVQIQNYKSELGDLEKEVEHLRKMTSTLEKRLEKKSRSSKAELKHQKTLVETLGQTLELVEDIMRFAKGEKALVHIFKTYGSRQKVLEKKFKQWRSDNLKFLQTGVIELNEKKKKFL